MATTFKTFLSDDVASTRTLLHEGIPITGGLLFGTYTEPGVALSNIKTYAHGMFQSVYDYSYTKSSANHIFDLTVGVSSSTGLTLANTVAAMETKKQIIYNEFAKILVGHDTDGAIQQFDEDGDLTAGDKIKECFVISVARLLNKDEIKKGSFYLDLDVSARLPVSGVCAADAATAATGTVTIVHQTNAIVAGNKIVFNTLDGTTITATASATTTTATNTDSPTFDIVAVATNNGIAAALATCLNANGKISATASSAVVTITQLSAGYTVNAFTITETNVGAITSTAFTGGDNGDRYELRISDSDATANYRINSPVGEYGILKCDTYKKITLNNDATCTDNTTTTVDYSATLDATFVHNTVPANSLDRTAGLIFYQAGVVVLNPFIFERYEDTELVGGYAAAGTHDGRLPPDDFPTFTTPDRPIMTSASTSVDAMFEDENIEACATALRKRINKLAFNNTTELNSTIYFCRASHNDFNYSSNPTYLGADDGGTGASKIRVKKNQTDAPVSYITSVGLYSADNELLAVAKLSEPLRKDPTNEMVLRVRLDY